MSDSALEVIGLNKNFGALEVAQNIDFTLKRGARHALIGPNGAGKTTFIDLITGVFGSIQWPDHIERSGHYWAGSSRAKSIRYSAYLSD